MAHEHESGAIGGLSSVSGILISRRSVTASVVMAVATASLSSLMTVASAPTSPSRGSAMETLSNLSLYSLDGFAHLVVLGAVHQMGGLDDQVLDTVGNSAVESLLHVVDLLAVTGLDMVDDDLGGEGAADGPIRVSGLQSILDALDVGRAAAVERGAEA